MRNFIKMENNNKQKSNKIFIILSGILFLLSGFLGWQLYNQKTQTQTIIVEKEKVINQYEDVKTDLQEVKLLYDGLKTNNAELQMELDAKKFTLDSLNLKLERYKNDAYMVQKLKAELTTIRNLIKSYLRDIDSLNTLTQTLRVENSKVKNDLKDEQFRTEKLNVEKKELNAKIDIAARLKAYELFADAIKEKGSKQTVVTKAKKADKVRACFTLTENKLAKASDITIFMKITAPGGAVLANGTEAENQFTVNGQKQMYSAKKDVAYEQKEVNVCMYFTKTADFMPGKYKIEIFAEGSVIGTTSFILN